MDPDVQAMEARVREALGTKVAISTARRGGRITITWYDDEDLARALGRARQLMVERIDRDHVGARLWIGDEAAGQPAFGIEAPGLGVEIFGGN